MIGAWLSPLRFGVLFGLLVLLTWRWLPRWARRLAVAAGLVLVWLTTPFGANALVGLQEARVPAEVVCAAPPPQTIVVLGGGMTRAPRSDEDYGALGVESLRRVFAALALQREHPGAALVFSGASRHAIAESTTMAHLAQALGVAADRLRSETASRTTWHNAQAVAALDPPLPRRIWLVTSALHMPRARYAFEAAGFEVCTAPAPPQYAEPAGLGYVLPIASAAAKSEAVLHEWAGETAYRLGLFRTTERDPEPASGER
ncbi:MAG TPA: YdcF family protein [Dokdonella sp.]|uniref:YdcF family protein n=1 Tax=Dokdonella sp. TaxID=2291710 RepID=UPI002C4F7A7A|nr:YdcF family protein [Dokdonella sp.]HUD43640.1 YdcF family protein [Dokdonella sp.]